MDDEPANIQIVTGFSVKFTISRRQLTPMPVPMSAVIVKDVNKGQRIVSERIETEWDQRTLSGLAFVRAIADPTTAAQAHVRYARGESAARDRRAHHSDHPSIFDHEYKPSPMPDSAQ